MELLILGASGYIGGAIYAEAKKRGISVIGTRNHTECKGLVKFDVLDDIVCDLVGEFLTSEDSEKYAVICAALPKIDDCLTRYAHTYNVNVTSTKRVIDELKRLGFTVLFFSSDYVFDGACGYYDESDTPIPITKYGEMKLEVENYILKYYPDDIIFRISKIMGEFPHKSNPLNEWHKQSKENKPILCIAENIFSPTDISDIVNCVFMAFEKNLKGLYNVCGNEHFERIELARQFLRSIGVSVHIENKPLDHFGFKDARSLKTYMCNDKFIEETGYRFRSAKDVFFRYKENSLAEERL